MTPIPLSAPNEELIERGQLNKATKNSISSFEIRSIVGKRVSSTSGVEYLVVWAGFSLLESTWEVEKNLDCLYAITSFEAQLQCERRSGASSEHFEKLGLAILLKDVREVYNDRKVFGHILASEYELQDEPRQTLELTNAVLNKRPRAVRIIDAITDTNGKRYYCVLLQEHKWFWAPANRLSIPSKLIQEFEHQAFSKNRSNIGKRQLKRLNKYLLMGNWSRRAASVESDNVNVGEGDGPKEDTSPIINSIQSVELSEAQGSLRLDPEHQKSTTNEDDKANDIQVVILPYRPGINQQGYNGKHTNAKSLELCKDEDIPDTMEAECECVFMDLLSAGNMKIDNSARVCFVCNQLAFDSGTVSLTLRPAEGPSEFASGEAKLDRHNELVKACSYCGIPCHESCFRWCLTKPLSVEEATEPIDVSSVVNWSDMRSSKRNWQCICCQMWPDADVVEVLTARPGEGVEDHVDWLDISKTILKSNNVNTSKCIAKPLYRQQLLVRFSRRSFLHLAWVPFIWLYHWRPSLVKAFLHRLCHSNPPEPKPRNRAVEKNWTKIERIFNAEFNPKSVAMKKKSEFFQSIMTEKLNWDETSQQEPAVTNLYDEINARERDADFYSEVKALFIKWKGLDTENSTWESIPDPVSRPEMFFEWSQMYQRWIDKSKISCNKATKFRQKLSSGDRGHNAVCRQYYSTPSFIACERNSGGGESSPVMSSSDIVILNFLLQRQHQRSSSIITNTRTGERSKSISQIVAFLASVYCSSIPPGMLSDAGINKSDLGTCNKGTFPFLVICPGSMISEWLQVFDRLAPFLFVEPFYGNSESLDLQSKYGLWSYSNACNKKKRSPRDMKCHVVISSFDAVISDDGLRMLKSVQIPWECMVVYENNRQRKYRANIFSRLEWLKVNNRIFLTDSPLDSAERSDLLSLMSFVDPEHFGTLDELEAKYSDRQLNSSQGLCNMLFPYCLINDESQSSKLEFPVPVCMAPLQSKLYCDIVSRKMAVLKAICESIGTSDASDGTYWAKLAKDRAIVILKDILKKMREILGCPRSIVKEYNPTLVKTPKFRQQLINECGKLKFLRSLLKRAKKVGTRVLILSRSVRDINVIESVVIDSGLLYIKASEDLSRHEFQQCVERFNTQESFESMLLATTSFDSFGFCMNNVNTVVCYDSCQMPVNLGWMSQPPLVLRLITCGSVEEAIMRFEAQKAAPDSDESESGKFGIKDLLQVVLYNAELLFDKNADRLVAEREITHDDTSVSTLLSYVYGTSRADTQGTRDALTKWGDLVDILSNAKGTSENAGVRRSLSTNDADTTVERFQQQSTQILLEKINKLQSLAGDTSANSLRSKTAKRPRDSSNDDVDNHPPMNKFQMSEGVILDIKKSMHKPIRQKSKHSKGHYNTERYFKFKNIVSILASSKFRPLVEPTNVFNQDIEDLKKTPINPDENRIIDSPRCLGCNKTDHKGSVCPVTIHPVFPKLLKELFKDSQALDHQLTKQLRLWYNSQLHLFHLKGRTPSPEDRHFCPPK